MNTLQTVNPNSSHPKICATHLSRLAYIYVRQSTPGQVAHNLESQMLQRQLAEHAETLGWRADRVRIIDSDLARSGTTTVGRDGLHELVAEVSLGRVGIIFSWQVSRVARNNTDWYQLLDLAAQFDTLLADIDGVYDLRIYNDRFTLGMKGAMSEAELHWMRQRLDAGRMNKIKRGAFRQKLPTGLVRLEDGRVVKDPDDQVRHTIELVLLKFEELGSCGNVMRYLRAENILLPRRQSSGALAGKLLWKQAKDEAVYQIVLNPAYAGAFVHGRHQVDPGRPTPGKGRKSGRRRPMSDWFHIQQDVYPAYIRWEQYVANQEQLHQNSMNYSQSLKGTQGAVREGAALLQGMICCGHCGHAMRAGYNPGAYYTCQALTKSVGGPTCLRFTGATVEAVVLQAFFDALRPANIDALETVLESQQADHQRLRQQWDERLKRARYEAQVAQRSYEAVDAENRLVAAELERRWEAALRVLGETQDAVELFQRTPRPTTPPADLRAQLKHLSETLPELWPTLPHEQQKALLRSFIARVICRRETADRVEVRIVWVSGHYSVFKVRTGIQRQQDLSNYTQLVERVAVLWKQGLNDVQIAAQLTSEGFHSAREAQVSSRVVGRIRFKHGWHLALARSRNALELDGCWTARGLAAQLSVTKSWIYNLVHRGIVPPTYVSRHPQSQVWLIRKDPELLRQLRALSTGNAKGK